MKSSSCQVKSVCEDASPLEREKGGFESGDWTSENLPPESKPEPQEEQPPLRSLRATVGSLLCECGPQRKHFHAIAQSVNYFWQGELVSGSSCFKWNQNFQSFIRQTFSKYLIYDGHRSGAVESMPECPKGPCALESLYHTQWKGDNAMGCRGEGEVKLKQGERDWEDGVWREAAVHTGGLGGPLRGQSWALTRRRGVENPAAACTEGVPGQERAPSLISFLTVSCWFVFFF